MFLCNAMQKRKQKQNLQASLSKKYHFNLRAIIEVTRNIRCQRALMFRTQTLCVSLRDLLHFILKNLFQKLEQCVWVCLNFQSRCNH